MIGSAATLEELRASLQPDLLRLAERLRAISPQADIATFASLLIVFGAEIALDAGNVPPAGLASYLRTLAAAVERPDPSESPPESPLPEPPRF